MCALISGFHHVCIKTRDWDRTMSFYLDTLGFTEKITWSAAPQRKAMLDAGDGNYLEVFEDHAYPSAPDGAVFHFALRTEHLDEVLTRVRATGAKITMEPKSITIATTNAHPPVPIRVFFCVGPSGESIEFFQNSLT